MPPGGAMPMGGGNQPAEAGAAIKYGWEKFKQHWQVILTALIVGFVAVAILGGIGFLIQRAMTSTGDCSVRVTNGVFRSSGCESPGFLTTLAATGVFQVLYYLGTTILQLRD